MRSDFVCIMSSHKEMLVDRGVEFYAANSWKNMREEWKEFLLHSSMEDVIFFVNATFKQIGAETPESLKTLKSSIEKLCYDRKCVTNPHELWKKWTGSILPGHLQNQFHRITSSNGLIRKKIKPKKQHEIDRIVELVSQIQMYMMERSEPIDSLVDIGAGVGHLSRIISLKNKLPVMAVEGSQQYTLAASSLDERFMKNSSRQHENMNFEVKPIRYTNFVTEELASKIDDFASSSSILVGLHCCGDFSSTILKVFRKSQKAKALILFGCCYHKEFQCFHFLSPTKSNEEKLEASKFTKSSVFPLSLKWSGCDLSYLQREIACHNNENMPTRFRKENIDVSRYARAHLEKWIWRVSGSPDDRNIGMCSVKCIEDETSFEEYIRKALGKRGNHLLDKVLEIIPKEELSRSVSSLRCSKFDSFDVLRLIFAPAIESAIIDDRLEFLRENGIKAKCVPLFDPIISPRNLAIVAYKV